MTSKPLVVGIGGTSRRNSSSELSLRACLERASSLGAETELFCGDALDLPMYGAGGISPKAHALIDALRRCDGLVLSSPSYHGAISGALKNALDYVEELRKDIRPYLEGRAVGTIVCAYGPQAIGTTLIGIRSIVHALRAWPTPMGAGINSSGMVFDDAGCCIDEIAREQIELVAAQVVEFSKMKRLIASHNVVARAIA